MDQQLKRFDLPEFKAEMSINEKLDAFLKLNGIKLLPFQREILNQIVDRKKICICYPPNNGRTDFRVLQCAITALLRGE